MSKEAVESDSLSLPQPILEEVPPSRENLFVPGSIDELKQKLNEKGIDYSQWENDSDRGPQRLFEETISGKNTLVETPGKLYRSSRVLRGTVITVVGGQEYSLRLARKISNKTGSEVQIKEEEAAYPISKALKADQTPEAVIADVIKEDLGENAQLVNADFVGKSVICKHPSPESKIPWISSRYVFETYRIQVVVPGEIVKAPFGSKGRAWTTIREWVLIT